MRIKSALLCGILSGLLLCGCDSATAPEIIMPDQPMASAADAQQAPADQNNSDQNNSDNVSADQTTASDQNTGSDAQPSQDYNVYLITMDLTDSYWKSIDDGCLKAVEELGNIHYNWTGPDAHDDALQSACIDDAVSAGADAILIAANSADGINDSLQKATEAGCKIVYVDSAATYDCVAALSTDNTVAGKTAGETMISALKAKGITSGTIGVMGVTADTASCVARETGFREAFEGTDFTLADTTYMQDDASNIKTAVQDGILQNYVGFFGTNEGTSVAIGEAMKEMETTDYTVVGFDTSNDVLALVSEGVIYATMQQNPEVMGHDGLDIAIQALEGTYTDTNVKTDTGVTVITKDSM